MILDISTLNRRTKFLDLIAISLLLILVYPLFEIGEMPFYDWPVLLQQYSAIEKIILEYNQFPFLNPWVGGGQPLGHSPNVGLLSIRTIFVLLFGASKGFFYAYLAYMLLIYIGSRKLGNLIWPNSSYLAILFAFLFSSNSPYFSHILVGHNIAQTVVFFPWVMYYLMNYKDDNLAPYKAALFFSASMYESVSYGTQYIALLLFLLFCLEFFSNSRHRSNLIRWGVVFLLVAMTLSAYRIITTLDILDGYYRVIDYGYKYPLKTVLRSLIDPSLIVPDYIVGQQYCAGSWEISMYIGIPAMFFMAYSFKGKITKFHFISILVVLSTIGNSFMASPMYWVKYLPTFSSHLCTGRIRIIAIIFIFILVVDGVRKFYSDISRFKYKKLILTSLTFLFLHPYINIFFGISESVEKMRDKYDDKYINEISINNNISDYPVNIHLKEANLRYLTRITEKGYGVANVTSASNISPPKSDIVKPKDHENYIGEFIQNSKLIEPSLWTPNIIIFNNIDPNKPIYLNMSLSNAWLINGEYIYNDQRAYEADKQFIAFADSQGSLSLIYKPRFHNFAIKVSIFLLFLTLTFFYFDKRRLKLLKNI
jgi:hypothetical protein